MGSTNIKFWVSISPLARLAGDNWTCAVYKKGKVSWITEACKTFNSPEEAGQWGDKVVKELEDADRNRD